MIFVLGFSIASIVTKTEELGKVNYFSLFFKKYIFRSYKASAVESGIDIVVSLMAIN